MKNKLAEYLKNKIDNNGFAYLSEKPFQIYEDILKNSIIDDTNARILLVCLLSKAYISDNKSHPDKEELSVKFQELCGLKESVAEQMAEVFAELFGEENISEWEKKKYSGFDKFCSSDWDVEWKGFSVWKTDGGSVDCEAEATITLRVSDKEKFRKDCEKELNKNPFISAEELFKIYSGVLIYELNSDFEEYCSADDYYSPGVEDYEYNGFEDVIKLFCEDHGFELIEYDFSGDEGDFESDYCGGRW